MAVVFVAIVVGYSAMIFSHLPGVFGAPEEDMDYAWFVPVFSLFVLFNERKRIIASLGKPSLAGALASIPFILLGLLGARGLQVRFELIAFVGLAVTVPWAFFGKETAKRVLFPSACLLFCMPLASYLSLLTVHLRLVVSAAAAGTLSLFGMDIVRQGNMISLPSVIFDGKVFGVDVANPCSGLRSIFALMALSVGYGYFTQRTWTRRAVMFALSIPIAMFSNIVRIMTICLVANFSSPGFAIGFYHDFSGLIVFAVAIALMVLSGNLMDRMPYRETAATTPGDAAPPASAGSSRSDLFKPMPFAVLVIAAMVYQIAAPDPRIAEPPHVEFIALDGFTHEDLPPSEGELNLLKGAILGRRHYTHEASGFWFQISKVISGPNKQSLHRPELCLPSQGQDMGSSSVIEVAGVKWTMIPLLPKNGKGGALFAYTFFNQEGYKTPSHESRILCDIWDRTVKSRIDRWTMLTVTVPCEDEGILRQVLSLVGRVVP